jgi:hypothetical protein
LVSVGHLNFHFDRIENVQEEFHRVVLDGSVAVLIDACSSSDEDPEGADGLVHSQWNSVTGGLGDLGEAGADSTCVGVSVKRYLFAEHRAAEQKLHYRDDVAAHAFILHPGIKI